MFTKNSDVLQHQLARGTQFVRRIGDVARGVPRAEGERTDGEVIDVVEAGLIRSAAAKLRDERAADDHRRAGHRRAVLVAHRALGRAASEENDVDAVHGVEEAYRAGDAGRLLRAVRLDSVAAADAVVGIARNVFEQEPAGGVRGLTLDAADCAQRDLGAGHRRVVALEHGAEEQRGAAVFDFRNDVPR